MADHFSAPRESTSPSAREPGASPDAAASQAMPPALSPAWGAWVRMVFMLLFAPYMHAAYRVRGWGRLPFRRGGTLVVSNHVHDLDIVTMALHLFLAGPWRHPVFVASSRRLFEPGFMATRAPRLGRWLSRSDWSGVFRIIGLLPIENELRVRPLASLAWSVYRAHGDLRLADVFGGAADGALGAAGADLRLTDVLGPRFFRQAQARLALETLQAPYRSEMRLATRGQVEEDLARMRKVLRCGGTLHITPEGGCTADGGLQRLRAVLWRLAPFGRVYLAPISYDPFVGRRLSILYRVIRLPESSDIATALKAARPVTVSQILGAWLSRRDRGVAFRVAEAVSAVTAQMNALPPQTFIDPALHRHPERVVRAALAALVRLRLLREEEGRYAPGDRRTHPKFPWVSDIVGHQARFFAETRDALGGAQPAGGPE